MVLGVLLALLPVLTGSAAAHRPLVYEVRHDGAVAAYLVGTMHSEDQRVTALLPRLEPLIGRVNAVGIELVPDGVTLLAVTAAMLLPPDRNLPELIGDARYAALRRAAQALEKPLAAFERLKPWAAAVALGMPAAETGRSLDLEIYQAALRQGREVVGLETAAEQLLVFDGMPEALQIALLDDVIKNAAQLPKQLEELTAAYLAGDLDRLDRVARAQYAGMHAELVHWFSQTVIEQRNHRMLQRMMTLMGRAPVLVAVGAMHLPGDSGLIAGLERAGYRLEPWRY